MYRSTTFFTTLLLFMPGTSVSGQEAPGRALWSVETRVTNYLQNGYELQVFMVLPNSRFSIGLGVAGQDVSGNAKDLLFSSSDHDNLDIRLPWLVSGLVRYHFNESLEGFYGEISVGAEEFRIGSGEETQYIYNGFVVPLVEYRWFPWGTDGFFVNPKVGGIFTFAREDGRIINGTDYELRPLFPSPGLSVGWQFR